MAIASHPETSLVARTAACLHVELSRPSLFRYLEIAAGNLDLSLAAVPLTVFCLDYCIRYPACSLREIAARELETVSSSIDFDTRRDLSAQFKVPVGVAMED